MQPEEDVGTGYIRHRIPLAGKKNIRELFVGFLEADLWFELAGFLLCSDPTGATKKLRIPLLLALRL